MNFDLISKEAGGGRGAVGRRIKGGKAKLHNTKSLVAIDGGTGTGIDAPVFA